MATVTAALLTLYDGILSILTWSVYARSRVLEAHQNSNGGGDAAAASSADNADEWHTGQYALLILSTYSCCIRWAVTNAAP